MRRILFIIAAVCAVAAVTTSCKSKNSNQKGQEVKQEQTTKAAALGVDEVLEKAESLAGKTLTLEAVCTHICQHGGGKIFLMGSDDTKSLRVEAGEKIGSFKPETVNSLVRVTGKLVEERIDEAYLQQWEERLKSQTEEKHGHNGQGCESSQKARGEQAAGSVEERIGNFRKRIADRQAKEGKNYLSFYFVEGESYEIVK